jgi:hypothetical protein
MLLLKWRTLALQVAPCYAVGGARWLKPALPLLLLWDGPPLLLLPLLLLLWLRTHRPFGFIQLSLFIGMRIIKQLRLH